MPIIVTLDVMLAKRKMSLSKLSEKTGVTVVALSLLKNGKSKVVHYATLNSLCETLNCKPGDIFDYMDEESYNKLMNR